MACLHEPVAALAKPLELRKVRVDCKWRNLRRLVVILVVVIIAAVLLLGWVARQAHRRHLRTHERGDELEP